MRKLNKPKSTSLNQAILAPLLACNKTPDSGEQAKKAYDALSQHRPPFVVLKKALKKSGCGKIIRDYATGAALYLDGRKAEALPFLLESNNATNNWYLKYLTGLCLIDFNRFEESKPLIDAGLAITDGSSDLWHLLGVYHQNKQEEEAACEAYQRSIDIEPDRAHTLSNLATGLEKLGHLEKALEHSARALELRPTVLPLLHNHAHILTRLGKFGEATKLYEHVAQQPNASAVSISSFFYNQLYNGEVLTDDLIKKNIKFGENFLRNFNPEHISPTPLNGRRLRVGYISGDLKRHSCAFFTEPLLRGHTSQVETFCFSLTARPDQFSAHLAQLPNHWFDMSQLDDARLTEFIRSKRLDILVDLSGHTAHNRLAPLCERAAPIQISYLGFPRSTWLPTVDYRLVDWHTDPEGSENHVTESLLRMPESFLTYQPLFGAPPIEEPPCLQSDKVTFGSFNNPLKISDETLQIWQRLLHEIPNSQLMLKGILFRHDSLKELVIKRFANHGIPAERLVVVPPTESDAEHLSSYNKVDIGLDPYPYHGTTTTIEALLMGTPVISLSGQEHMSRVGTSILKNIGTDELIANSADEYIAIAKELAANHNKVLEYKSTLRERLLASPLCDHDRFVSFLERIYFHLHEHHFAKSFSNLIA